MHSCFAKMWFGSTKTNFITVACFLATSVYGINSATNVLVIYDGYFKDQINAVNFTLLTNQTNASWEIVEIPQNGTLQNHLSNANLKNSFRGNNQVAFLFADEAELLSNFFQQKHSLVLKYGTAINQLESSIQQKFNSICTLFTPLLLKSLTYLIYSLFQPQVAIITDSSCACADTFFIKLQKTVNSSLYKTWLEIQLTHAKVHENWNRESAESQYYGIKSGGFNVIILLTSKHVYSHVFWYANNFSLLSSPIIWVVPNAESSDFECEFQPARLFTVEVARKEFMTKRFTKLKEIMESSSEFLQDLAANPNNYDDTLIGNLYQKALSIEMSTHQENIDLKLRYRNVAISSSTWIEERAYIENRRLHLLNNNMEFLKTLNPTIHTAVSRLQCVTVIDKPFTFVDHSLYDEHKNQCSYGIKCTQKNPLVARYRTTCCVGFIIDLFQMVMKETGLIGVDMYVVEDAKYGVVDRHGKWNGMIADVIQGKADIAVAGITITEQREREVNFTQPFLEAEMGIIAKPSKKILGFINFEFLSPLSGELQLMLWFVIVGTMVLNYAFENNLYVYSLTTSERKSKYAYYSTFESMSYISGVTLQRDLGGVNPKRPGTRLLAVAFAFVMVFIVTTYTAVLAAQSVQDQEQNPFEGSKDQRMRNPGHDFRFGLLKSSNYETFFRKSEVDTFQRMGKFMEPYNVYATYEGVERVKNGSLEAFIGDYKFLYWYVSNDQSCELRVHKDTLMQGGYGFAMNKHLIHASNINQAIVKYTSSSHEINNLYQKWFHNACAAKFSSPSMVRLSINHFGGLILILCVTSALCFPLLLPEHIYERHFKDKISQRIKGIFVSNRKKQQIKDTKELSKANAQLSVVLNKCSAETRERSFSVIDAIKRRTEALAKFE